MKNESHRPQHLSSCFTDFTKIWRRTPGSQAKATATCMSPYDPPISVLPEGVWLVSPGLFKVAPICPILCLESVSEMLRVPADDLFSELPKPLLN